MENTIFLSFHYYVQTNSLILRIMHFCVPDSRLLFVLFLARYACSLYDVHENHWEVKNIFQNTYCALVPVLYSPFNIES